MANHGEYFELNVLPIINNTFSNFERNCTPSVLKMTDLQSRRRKLFMGWRYLHKEWSQGHGGPLETKV